MFAEDSGKALMMSQIGGWLLPSREENRRLANNRLVVGQIKPEKEGKGNEWKESQHINS